MGAMTFPTTSYRISAHERLVDIAAAHGTTTSVLCAMNPHKQAVEVPGLGAVFTDMIAGEEIHVPGVGRGGFASPIKPLPFFNPDVVDPNAIATWTKQPSKMIAKVPVATNTSVSGGTAFVFVPAGSPMPGGSWQMNQQNDGKWTVSFTHYGVMGAMQDADFIPGLIPFQGDSKKGFVDCGVWEPGKPIGNKELAYFQIS